MAKPTTNQKISSVKKSTYLPGYSDWLDYVYRNLPDPLPEDFSITKSVPSKDYKSISYTPTLSDPGKL